MTADRVAAILATLDALYPDAECELVHEGPFQLLVATVLSAQATDVGVNRVTPALFARFADVHALAAAEPENVVPYIRTLGLFNNKAKALVGLARRIVTEHDGRVPPNLEALIELPGVARKTANVVLQNVWDISVGVVVDTHVARLSQRLGLTATDKVAAIERDLMAAVPRAHWRRLSHQIILHGRRVCSARRPACEACALARLCPSANPAPDATG